MSDASVSFAGNLTDTPEVRHSEGGIARAMFRVAVSGRREGEPSFFTVVVWRDQAEHATASLAKGSRVVVVGRLAQRSWQADDGTSRSAVEVVAVERVRRRCRREPDYEWARDRFWIWGHIVAEDLFDRYAEEAERRDQQVADALVQLDRRAQLYGLPS
jgi:single-strand DNA-binding protein